MANENYLDDITKAHDIFDQQQRLLEEKEAFTKIFALLEESQESFITVSLVGYGEIQRTRSARGGCGFIKPEFEVSREGFIIYAKNKIDRIQAELDATKLPTITFL